MLIKFSEEQTMIRDMVREFTKKEVEPRDKWTDENGFDFNLYNRLCSTGQKKGKMLTLTRTLNTGTIS